MKFGVSLVVFVLGILLTAFSYVANAEFIDNTTRYAIMFIFSAIASVLWIKRRNKFRQRGLQWESTADLLMLLGGAYFFVSLVQVLIGVVNRI
jgi:hypothetical protein